MIDKSEDSLSEQRIRVRAYEIFQRRGGQGGSPDADWLLAREELIRETAASAPPQPDTPAARSARSARAAAETAEPVAAPPKKSVRNVRPNTASRRSR